MKSSGVAPSSVIAPPPLPSFCKEVDFLLRVSRMEISLHMFSLDPQTVSFRSILDDTVRGLGLTLLTEFKQAIIGACM